MDNLLILTTRHLQSAPRVLREVEAFKNTYSITAAGHSPLKDKLIGFIDISVISQSPPEKMINIFFRLMGVKPPVVQFVSKRLNDLAAMIEKLHPAVVITHEPHFLPYLVILKKRFAFKLVYNAHEYHPLEFTDSWKWNWLWKPYYEGIYRSCLPEVDLLVNVCDSIAEKCKTEFGKESLVIPNVSVFHDLAPIDNSGNPVVQIIHHGGCLASRKIEMMIEVVAILGDGYHLDLMLTLTKGPYFDKIKELASRTRNVSIIDPVSFEQIVPATNKYDIGIFLLPPTNYNYSVALPNKLFEFMQARLCIAIGPSPEMMRYVKTYDLGIISEEFTAANMAKEIKALRFDQIYKYKQHANKAAGELSAEKFNKLFLDSVRKL